MVEIFALSAIISRNTGNQHYDADRMTCFDVYFITLIPKEAGMLKKLQNVIFCEIHEHSKHIKC